jgi:hypothetical protein
LRSDQVRLCAQATDGSWKAFELVANVKAWKTNARIVIVQEFKKDNSLKRVRILGCNPNQHGWWKSVAGLPFPFSD